MLLAEVVYLFDFRSLHIVVFGRVIFVIGGYDVVPPVVAVGIQVALLHLDGAAIGLLVGAYSCVEYNIDFSFIYCLVRFLFVIQPFDRGMP